MNIDKFCHSLGITTEIYIAVLEEEQRVALISSKMLTRAKRINDLKERERHREEANKKRQVGNSRSHKITRERC